MSEPINPQLLLTCLERFEKQAHSITNDDHSTELFCKEVIPFLEQNPSIDLLKQQWRQHRAYLQQKIEETSAQALLEIRETYQELKKALLNSDDSWINQKITLIDRLFKEDEKLLGNPLYRILYDELKGLLQLLLAAGYEDLCHKYAKLTTRQIYVQKDPQQTDRWVRVLDNGNVSHFLSEEEIQTAKKWKKSLLGVPPEYELKDKVFIEEFTFAPAVIKAYAAKDAIYWRRHREPSIIWWYFESALWCWRTPESYFDQLTASKNGDNPEKHFHTICQKCTWQEIASIRDQKRDSAITIFTKDFFRHGLTTLINAIGVFLSHGMSSPSTSLKLSKSTIVFELMLDDNELWVKATFENGVSNKFYVQKFYEGINAEGSPIFKFVKDLFKSPGVGSKRAKLIYKWETASKHINRLKLPIDLKKAFFGNSYGSSFNFNGIRVELPSDCNKVLNELQKRHLKMPYSLKEDK